MSVGYAPPIEVPMPTAMSLPDDDERGPKGRSGQDDDRPVIATMKVRPVHRPHVRPTDEHIARYVRARCLEPNGQANARLSGSGTGREPEDEPGQ
jgi:hypothetical protein